MTESAMIGIGGFILMLVLIMLHVPVFAALMISAAIGMSLIASPAMVLSQFSTAPFATAASYSFAVMPMFMLMGVFAEDTGIAEGAFTAVNKWLHNLRGGLLYTVVVANTIFGACSGVPSAGNIVFAKLSMPSLEKAGYDKSNALACISASSCLASMIPPSSSILMSCMITELSISRGLMCGIGAGILMTVFFLLVVKLVSVVQPYKIPKTEKVEIPLREKLQSLTLLVPIALLFIIIIVGAYTGFFSATVGGAVGAFVVIVYALFKRIPPKRILNVAMEAAVLNGSVFPLIIAGTMFGRFVTLSGLPAAFVDIIQEIHAPTIVIFTIIIVFYLICGCLMDMLSIILITVPIVFPILTALGFDEYALLIMLVFVTSIGGITPPIGMSVFLTANTMRVDPAIIFKGIIPYFIAEIAALYVIAYCPAIINFLPNLLA